MIYETSKSLTELWERLVEVLRNHVPPTELKKVANKDYETFWDPPNLKSFGGKVANFQSSGKDLFFLECRREKEKKMKRWHFFRIPFFS